MAKWTHMLQVEVEIEEGVYKYEKCKAYKSPKKGNWILQLNSACKSLLKAEEVGKWIKGTDGIRRNFTVVGEL